MSTADVTPPAAASGAAGPVDPQAVVVSFLTAIQDGELEYAASLLAEDAQWINVSLPTLRGRARIAWLSQLLMGRLGVGFRVHLHAVASDGNVVLTERDDALVYGRVEQRFWVWGRFEVEDGLITVWRDSFDWRDYIVGFLRGVAGAVVPRLNRPWPGRR